MSIHNRTVIQASSGITTSATQRSVSLSVALAVSAPTELAHSLITHLDTHFPARPLTHSLPLLPYHRQVAVQHAADMSTQLHYHSVYRRLSLAARQLQWSVTLLYCHTLCRGLAVSLTLLCRLSISHLTTSRSAKGQVGPSTYKRGGHL